MPCPGNTIKFLAQRSAPFEDLCALIRVREGMSVVDLGCGSGELTRRLEPSGELCGEERQ